jgi:hypothetical protein
LVIKVTSTEKEQFKVKLYGLGLYLGKMAASVLASRNQKFSRVGSSIRDHHTDLIPMPLLPDEKEWIAEHDIEMLMLDGYECNLIQKMQGIHLLLY